MSLLDQNNSDKEVKGIVIFGYILLVFVVIMLISFIAFVVNKKINGSDDTEANARIEQSVDSESLADLGYTFSDNLEI
jgi:uncharacterized protein YpmB